MIESSPNRQKNVSLKRKRNQWLELANELVKTPKFRHENIWYQYPRVRTDNDATNAYGALDIIMQYAEKYKDETYDKAIVLKNEENKLKIIPYLTRFSPDYYKKPFKDISMLKQVHQFHTSIFLTLTIDPKRYFCEKDAYEALMTEWNRLKTWIRKHDSDPMTLEVHEIAKNWNGEYVSVVEFQQKSTKTPHLHILLLGCTWLDVNAVREQWGKYMGASTFFKAELVKPLWYRDDEGNWHKYTAIDYILKYMKKASENEEHLALLWALNAHAYNTSRSLIADIKAIIFNSPFEHFKLLFDWLFGHTWTYVGCFPLALVQDCQTIDDLYSVLSS